MSRTNLEALCQGSLKGSMTDLRVCGSRVLDLVSGISLLGLFLKGSMRITVKVLKGLAL